MLSLSMNKKGNADHIKESEPCMFFLVCAHLRAVSKQQSVGVKISFYCSERTMVRGEISYVEESQITWCFIGHGNDPVFLF